MEPASPEPNPSVVETRWNGLFCRRLRWGLTRRGWAALGLVTLVAIAVFLRGIHPFLAVNAPVQADVLVVEGWAADHAMKAALQEFNRGGYSGMYVTGGPLERGAPLSEYETYAALGAAVLDSFGASTQDVHPVPGRRVKRDRTYASAVALREWFESEGELPDSLNLVSVGPHARRSRLLYEEAFGGACEIGVIAVEDEEYDPDRWWAYSNGVRAVLSESVGYLYARVLFPFSAERAVKKQSGEDSVKFSP